MQSRQNLPDLILNRVLIFGLISTMSSFQAYTKIAFTSYRDANREIYVMDADGSNLRNLTRNPAWDSRPAWSPDGGRIAFESYRDGDWEIYVMDANGENPQRRTKHFSHDLAASWSPSGDLIAFQSFRGGSFEIYMMAADGRNLRNLTNNNDANDETPSWSPDGERIAFTSSGNRNEHDSNIYVMAADGGNLQKLTKDPEADNWPDWARSAFSVSPAGKQLTMWGWLKESGYNEK